MAISWRNLIVGSPLRTAEQAHQRLTKTKALAIFSSDALSSVAYATEEILLVLVAVGTAAFYLAMPIALTITGLLVIVAISYYQTIHGYPSGGGAYIVAHENLGVWPGLVAAAALLSGGTGRHFRWTYTRAHPPLCGGRLPVIYAVGCLTVSPGA